LAGGVKPEAATIKGGDAKGADPAPVRPAGKGENASLGAGAGDVPTSSGPRRPPAVAVAGAWALMRRANCPRAPIGAAAQTASSRTRMRMRMIREFGLGE